MITVTQIEGIDAETLLARLASIDNNLQEIRKAMRPTVPKDEFLTQKEVAALFKVSLPTLWRWSKAEVGILTPHHVGNQVRYLKSEVLAAITKKQSKTHDEA
jgi:predicted DNA-binding transcriptional regulator AlpA